jgi:hypothetical protein
MVHLPESALTSGPMMKSATRLAPQACHAQAKTTTVRVGTILATRRQLQILAVPRFQKHIRDTT